MSEEISIVLQWKETKAKKMSFRVVRESKFRNIFAPLWKREQCYEGIRVSKSSWDSTMCSVNPKFLAVIVESAGGGAFIVFPLSKVGRIPVDFPVVGGHKGPVLDIMWCPHNDNLIASGSEDTYVRVWQIPESPMSRTMTDPLVTLELHQRRVGQVLWHPSAKDILLSVGSDNLVVIWDIGQGIAISTIKCHPDIIYSTCWSFDGSKLVTACKDKKLRVIDARTGEVILETHGHEGSKASRAIFLKNDQVFTTGFSRTSERQYSLRSAESLDIIALTDVDSSNGMMFPVYNPDNNMIFLCGKGDSCIRSYEVNDEQPLVHFITNTTFTDPQRGFGFMPKRGLNSTVHEIARFYRLNNAGFCQVVPILVPRKSERFQEDLYPDTAAPEAALTATQWFQGENATPVLSKFLDLQIKKPAPPKPVRVPHSAPAASVAHAAGEPQSGPSGAERPSSPTASGSYECDCNCKKVSEEIHRLKAVIVKQENRIRHLERDVAMIKDFVNPSSGEDGDEGRPPALPDSEV